MEWISLVASLLFSTTQRDDAAAREAFRSASTVLMHPRCMNCHPAGDQPLQGDDSHVHIQNVKRGATGHGKYGMKCDTCHQDTNLPGANMPPGVHDWHMPLPTMKLVFEGKSAGELCRQMKDPVPQRRKKPSRCHRSPRDAAGEVGLGAGRWARDSADVLRRIYSEDARVG